MPDSVEMPAPLSTSTPPVPSASATGSRFVVRGGTASAGVQLRVGRMRMSPGYGTGRIRSFAPISRMARRAGVAEVPPGPPIPGVSHGKEAQAVGLLADRHGTRAHDDAEALVAAQLRAA